MRATNSRSRSSAASSRLGPSPNTTPQLRKTLSRPLHPRMEKGATTHVDPGVRP